MGGWVGIYFYFNLKIEFLFYFWLPNFLFNLINQKDYPMVNKKNH
jgi:hypothetical protein